MSSELVVDKRTKKELELYKDFDKDSSYKSFFKLAGVKNVKDLLPKLKEAVKETNAKPLSDINTEGAMLFGKHSDAFALQRDCHQRYACRKALIRKGFDYKLLKLNTLLGKYLVNKGS